MHRIGFDMSEKRVKDMDVLADRLGLTTRKDVFNTALTYLEWVVEEIEKGNQPGFKDQNGKFSSMRMPSFRNIKKTRL